MRCNTAPLLILFISAGEVRCLCIELEAEKSKVEKEREDKVHQLSQAEQKYQEALGHHEMLRKEERNTIFQELVSNYIAILNTIVCSFHSIVGGRKLAS